MIIALTVVTNEVFPSHLAGSWRERERGELERQEKKITDIKKTAKTGQWLSMKRFPTRLIGSWREKEASWRDRRRRLSLISRRPPKLGRW